MRGGEKVLQELCDLFPEADIYTHAHNPSAISDAINQHKISKSFIAKLPAAKKHFRKYLPLMPRALEALDLTEYDLVISSESGPAKGVITAPDSLHICYVHSPMRYLWDQYWIYKQSASVFEKLALKVFAPLYAHGILSALSVPIS